MRNKYSKRKCVGKCVGSIAERYAGTIPPLQEVDFALHECGNCGLKLSAFRKRQIAKWPKAQYECSYCGKNFHIDARLPVMGGGQFSHEVACTDDLGFLRIHRCGPVRLRTN